MSDRDDAVSETSTVLYTHEPFASFQTRVRALAETTLWPDTPAEDITVERLMGGGFNRIIGLRRDKTDYILRVPRSSLPEIDPDPEMARDVATLSFLRTHTKIPVPQVITYDDTFNNEMGLPYMLQNRMAGTSLHLSFRDLSHQQRCKLARELGMLVDRMLQTRSTQAGYCALMPGSEEPAIAPFRFSQVLATTPYTSGGAATPASAILKSLFEADRNSELAYNGPGLRTDLAEQLITMVSEMEQEGWLTDIHNCMVHLDLAPRNILVDTTSLSDRPVIAAILDWDGAGFAPGYLACEPPTWLWNGRDDDEDDSDKSGADDAPPTEETRQLKQIFEAAAGPDYLRWAYQAEYRLLRQLTLYAIHGVISSEDIRAADVMMDEWYAIYLQGKVD